MGKQLQCDSDTMYMAVEGTTQEGPSAGARALAVLTVATLPESAQSPLPPGTPPAGRGDI